MNILLLGSGGREHALAWKLAQSRLLRTASSTPRPAIPAIAAACRAGRARRRPTMPRSSPSATTQRIGLVVIGPEAPLVDGLADTLRAAGVAVFGPSRPRRSSKAARASPRSCAPAPDIPTAGYVRAPRWTRRWPRSTASSAPVVIKADGLAAGKGVIIAETPRRGRGGARRDVRRRASARPGAEVVIEEFLEGEEASFFALTDGSDDRAVRLGAGPQARRRRRHRPQHRRHGRLQPGAGADPRCCEGEAIEPDRRARRCATLAEEGTPYSGVLYAGLMLTREGPKLIEYNCRFGDPECQVLMMRLESDLAELLLACAENRLGALPAAALLAANRADRGDGGERLSGHARRRAARSTASPRPKRRGARSSTPAPRSTSTASWSPTAAACST